MTDARTFVIADIHGDVTGLESVVLDMYADGMDLENDTLVQLGDMIDGFPHSRTVVEFWRGLQTQYPNNVVVLLGNHEDMLMRAIGKHQGQSDFRNWWYQGGADTYCSYVDTDDDPPFLNGRWGQLPTAPFEPEGRLAEDVAWFKTLPIVHEANGFIFVHAGLREPMPLSAQKRHDLLWIREDFHNSTHDWGAPVVYGHTARTFPLVERNKIGLDCRWRGTGYVSGAELSREGKSGDPLYNIRKFYVG